MPVENYYQGIKHIVTVSTDDKLICEECKTSFTKNDLSGIVNHYIEQHKYKILHIGQQTDKTSNDDIFHLTVAVIGK